jgi:hypothetical protein
MLELKPKIIQVKLGDATYQVRVPTAREIKDMQGSEAADVDQSIALLDKLGLPSDVAWGLDVESLQKIYEALMPQKKS